MVKRKKRKLKKRFTLPDEVKEKIVGVLLVLAALLIGLSFFEKAGKGGQYFMTGARFLLGQAVFLTPLILVLAGLALLLAKKEKSFLRPGSNVFWPVILAIFILILSITGFLAGFEPETLKGGWFGYFASWAFLKYFGFWASQLIFSALFLIGLLILWHFLGFIFKKEKKEEEVVPTLAEKKSPGEQMIERPSIIKRIFGPKFKIKEVPGSEGTPEGTEFLSKGARFFPDIKPKISSSASGISYQPPPLNLLEPDRGVPSSGDTRINSAIIKKTFQNFGIEVAMSEVNVGPTVTQYTLKPAEGIKLSKITGLTNDLALALASHPIRIEAPIPGRSLVGIEVPNKIRARVGLRNLIESQDFQKSSANLVLALGRDVSGFPFFADLSRMPHLLVAGSTGTGKTIFLNSLILSLLYQPTSAIKGAGPENLRFILIDPKRVEFPVYNNLPHLLCPVIYNANQTISVLKWLTGEMERRFDVLSEAKSRDIASYNEKALLNKEPVLPFIVLIIDELADLMAAKGREIEAGIVRLAQMARAVGIHLVVATQRPSVEVITGLIKANITSRITFQVASQVDSRTVLDTAGAEKLLGLGDLLYVSAEVIKPKRIQAAYVSEKELRRVVKYVVAQNQEPGLVSEMDRDLVQELDKTSAESGASDFSGFSGFSGSAEDDSLFEEAKKVVLEAKKASASLLQRRLRVGYARAARLIDILEEKGIVGPGQGAKPREVYGQPNSQPLPQLDDLEGQSEENNPENSGENSEGDSWQKV